VLISGFSYIRNGFTFDYPFLEAIQSILPICDEFVIAVGDSTDGTREAIEKLGPKVRIIDTVWDMSLREGGKIFAQQANIALDAVKGKWAFHIQADEIIHENDLEKIRQAVLKYDSDRKVEGILLPFLNFWGSFSYIRTSRKAHRYEVRLFRTGMGVRSFRDSQGFRKYSSKEAYENGEKGIKLKVVKVDAPVYHYSYVRPPDLMKKKSEFFDRFWHDDQWIEEKVSKEPEYDYDKIDKLSPFSGTHPRLMQDRVKAQNWEFNYDPSKAKMKLQYRILHFIEDLTGYRIGEYKNYKLIKR
jgi:glycosyltransferase involved in cell wall biosynthesis